MFALQYESYAGWDDGNPPTMYAYESLEDCKEQFAEDFLYDEPPSKEFIDEVMQCLLAERSVMIGAPREVDVVDEAGTVTTKCIGWSILEKMFGGFVFVYIDGEEFNSDGYQEITVNIVSEPSWDVRLRL